MVGEMEQQRAIRYHECGQPGEVLRLETIEKPEPGPGEVRVKLIAATINPSDLGMIGGSYGRLKELPAVGGREGVGEIEAIGAGVTGIEIGQRVRFPEVGAWQEFACLRADELVFVPHSVPVDQAALAFINPPTAWCLLTRMVNLPAGSWIVQNAGNSAVGLAVIQLARGLGFHTISQVRRESLVAPLRAMGADQVVLEGSKWGQNVEALTGGQPVRLALNSIGGNSAMDQIKILGEGGTQVTFGGMVGDPVRFPTRFLIFQDIKLVGFWWDKFCRTAPAKEVDQVREVVFAKMTSGELQLPTAARYTFEQLNEALACNQEPRLGKVLLVP